MKRGECILMYLVFIDNEFYGNTRSKRVVKSIKNIYGKVHALHINEYADLPFEYSYMNGDEYQIRIFELKKSNGELISVVSTDYEQEDARKWLNTFIWAKLSTDSILTPQMFEILPVYIKRHLSNYQPIESSILYDSNLESDNDQPYELTYEGFLLYLKRGDLYKLEKDLCMLSEEYYQY